MTNETKRPNAAGKAGMGFFGGIVGGILLGAITGKMGLCLAAGIFLGLIGGGAAARSTSDRPAS